MIRPNRINTRGDQAAQNLGIRRRPRRDRQPRLVRDAHILNRDVGPVRQDRIRLRRGGQPKSPASVGRAAYSTPVTTRASSALTRCTLR